MKYDLIPTLGPASTAPAMWQAFRMAGATAFRLNTSHLLLDELASWLERLDLFERSLPAMIPLILDLQGSKWRLGQMERQELAAGQHVTLSLASAWHQPGVLPVPHADFFRAASASNGEIVLNDARVRLAIESLAEERIEARVTLPGEVSACKGITFAACAHRIENLIAKDQAILEQTRFLPFVQYAVSYVKDGQEMGRYRSLLGPRAVLHAKIERQPALEDLEAIAQQADTLWVCRGDLGAELGLSAMACAVHHLTEQVGQISVPVWMAGQVLEYMSFHPVPTRSEICYLYDSLRHGYAGFVLSDETAIGRYPFESCQVAAMFRSE